MLSTEQKSTFLRALEGDPDAAALRQALRRCPDLVWRGASAFWDESDLTAAARVWSAYWSKRVEVFEGEAAAFQPWEEALTEDHCECLRSGAIVQLPDDSDGDAVLCVDRSRQISSPPLQIRLQVAFYMLSLLIQRRSVSVLFHLSVRASFRTPVNYHLTEWIRDAFPFKLKFVHIAGCPPLKAARRMFREDMVPNAIQSCGPAAKPLTIHGGDSKRDLLRKLLNVGFRKEGLPPCMGGSWEYRTFEKWLQQQQKAAQGEVIVEDAGDKKPAAKQNLSSKEKAAEAAAASPQVKEASSQLYKLPTLKESPRSRSSSRRLPTSATRKVPPQHAASCVAGGDATSPQLVACPQKMMILHPESPATTKSASKSPMKKTEKQQVQASPPLKKRPPKWQVETALRGNRNNIPKPPPTSQAPQRQLVCFLPRAPPERPQQQTVQHQPVLHNGLPMDSLLHQALRQQRSTDIQQRTSNALLESSHPHHVLAFLASVQRSAQPVSSFLSTQRQTNLSLLQQQQSQAAQEVIGMRRRQVNHATTPSLLHTTSAQLNSTMAALPQRQPLTTTAAAKIQPVEYTAVLQTLRLLPPAAQAAYWEATRQAPQVVERESAISTFWKVAQGNVVAAARRLASYWTDRKALFGDRAFRPMTCTGEGALSRNDVLLLYSGSISVLPPGMLYLDRSRCLKGEVSTECRLRCLFYLAHALKDENNVVMLKSLITPHVLPLDEDFLRRAADLATRSLPLNIRQWYFTVCPPKSGKKRALEQIIARALQIVPSASVHRAASPADLFGQLQRLGFPAVLPPTLGGEWKFEAFGRWLRDRSNTEQRLDGSAKTESGNAAATSAPESHADRKERKRLLNIIHSRQKRERRRGEMEGLQRKQEQLVRENKRLKVENGRLEGAVQKAHGIVRRIETSANEPADLLYRHHHHQEVAANPHSVAHYESARLLGSLRDAPPPSHQQHRSSTTTTTTMQLARLLQGSPSQTAALTQDAVLGLLGERDARIRLGSAVSPPSPWNARPPNTPSRSHGENPSSTSSIL